MASPPVLCVDNYFDDLLHTDHTVTGLTDTADPDEASGYEAWHVANGRRSASDYWTPENTNDNAYVKVDCGSAKAADFIAIDRNSNMEGQTVTLSTSSDDVTYSDVFSITFPSSSSADTAVSAATGAYTEEGAWVKTFTSTSARYWRLQVDAAASYRPQVGGLWLAAAWQAGANQYPDRPFDEDATTGAWQTVGNDLGWSANSSAAAVREGTLTLRLDSWADYDDTVRDFMALYRTGRPAWVVPNAAQAERAMLVRAPGGARVEAPYGDGWGYRVARLPYVEHEPALD